MYYNFLLYIIAIIYYINIRIPSTQYIHAEIK